MRLSREVIELGRLYLVDDATDCGRVSEIRVVQEQLLFVDVIVAVERLQTGSFERAAATHDTVNFVAFCEQKFGQVGTVLTCDSGDESDHGGEQVLG